MNNRDFKLTLIERLKNRNIFTEQTSSIQIRTRCPWCGDSRKNFQTGHLYLRINPNDNLPIVYNCFKCPAQGILTPEDLKMLGIEDSGLENNLSIMNNSSDNIKTVKTVEDKYFEYKLPDTYNYDKIQYVEKRLGLQFSQEDLKNIKIITSLRDFLLLNNIETITCKPNMAKLVERQYVGFLSNNNAYILFRDITDKQDIRWYKYPITNESQGQSLFYSIKSNIDLYSKDDITINMSEGVFDCLSIAYNIENNKKDNILNLAVCGKFYDKLIKHLLGIGFIGDNITINIYADNDCTEDTSFEFLKKRLKKYSYLVKEINVIYNTLSKDCGVPKEKILLQRFKI